MAVSQTRGGQLITQPLDFRTRLAARELRFELSAIIRRQSRRTDQSEPRGRWEMGVSSAFDRVKEREHRTPRITGDRRRVEPEFVDYRRQILDVCSPRDWISAVRF